MTKFEKVRRKLYELDKTPKPVKEPTIKKPLRRPPSGPGTRHNPNDWE